MTWRKSQLENLSKKDLTDELISVKLSDLTSCYDDFMRRYEILTSELTVSKNCNRLLTERTVQLERNAVSNAQYYRRESREISPVPVSIGEDVFENSVCRELSLTGYEIKPNIFQECLSPFEEKGHCNS